VMDSTQAVIPSASVVLTETDRNLKYTTATDMTGRYLLTALPPGNYVLKIEAPGFRTHVQPAFALVVQHRRPSMSNWRLAA